MAGRRPLPGSLYSATKFAATTIGKELRQVDDNHQIKVTLVEAACVAAERSYFCVLYEQKYERRGRT